MLGRVLLPTNRSLFGSALSSLPLPVVSQLDIFACFFFFVKVFLCANCEQINAN